MLRPVSRGPRMAAAEEKPVLELMRDYAAATSMSPEAAELAMGVLRSELSSGGLAGSGGAAEQHVDIHFNSVQLEGYSPFKEKQVGTASAEGSWTLAYILRGHSSLRGNRWGGVGGAWVLACICGGYGPFVRNQVWGMRGVPGTWR